MPFSNTSQAISPISGFVAICSRACSPLPNPTSSCRAGEVRQITHVTHNTGGAIMGDNPRTSVLNRYLQSWDVANLFVEGAGLQPEPAFLLWWSAANAAGLPIGEALLFILVSQRLFLHADSDQADLLQNLLGDQALSQSFQPVYGPLLERGEADAARRLAWAVGTLLVL